MGDSYINGRYNKSPSVSFSGFRSFYHVCYIDVGFENQSRLITEAWLILWLLERCGDALWIVAIAAPSLIHRFFPYSP